MSNIQKSGLAGYTNMIKYVNYIMTIQENNG